MMKITREIPELDLELVQELEKVDFPTFGHFLESGFVNPEIRRVAGTKRIIGRAVTVRTTDADSTLVHMVTNWLQPTDILVIDTGSNRRHAPVGGLVIAALQRAQVKGVIIDGVCTDRQALEDSGITVYARGLSTLTTKLLGLNQGGINVPIAVGGVPVLPGYVVAGDENGVMIAPAEDYYYVLPRVQGSDAAEPGIVEKLNLNPDVALADITGAGNLIEAAMATSN